MGSVTDTPAPYAFIMRPPCREPRPLTEPHRYARHPHASVLHLAAAVHHARSLGPAAKVRLLPSLLHGAAAAAAGGGGALRKLQAHLQRAHQPFVVHLHPAHVARVGAEPGPAAGRCAQVPLPQVKSLALLRQAGALMRRPSRCAGGQI